MKYRLAIDHELKEAFAYLTELSGKLAFVEIKRISPRRSLNQNSYLHLLLGAFGEHFGYTIEEAKTIYKRAVNPNIYVYEKNDQKFVKSSADLSSEDMATSIDKFMEYSKENGYELPLATDKGWLMEIENKIERSKRFL